MARGLDSQFSAARAAEKRGDFPAAAKIYVAVLTQYPGNARAQTAFAAMHQRIFQASGPEVQQEFDALFALYNSGQIAAVVERGRGLVAAYSGQPAFHNLYGAALIAQGLPGEAEAAFRNAIALSPAVADGYNNLGNALKDQKRLEEARAAYRQALERNYNYPEAWNNLGTVLQALELTGEALAAYDRALALRADFVDAINNRATALLKADRAEEAEAEFRRALELAPERHQIHSNLGDALLKQERNADAAAAFQRSVELQPDYADGWNNLGVALRKSGQLDASLVAYEKAIEFAPQLARVRTNRANLLMHEGNMEGAAADYVAGLEANPDDPIALNNLGLILQEGGYPAKALALYERALELKPGYVDAQNNRGNALRDMGWLSEAESAFTRALDENPMVSALWTNLAVARQDLGRSEEAIEAYSRALEIEPTLAEARMQRLYQRAQLCDWSIHHDLDAELALMADAKEAPSAFPALAMRDDPAFQFERAAGMARKWASAVPSPKADMATGDEDRRIRIGYFSGDFHDHAIMFLASGLFREHDRSRFEIFAYSSGGVRQGVMRERLIGDVEHFFDTLEMAEGELYQLVRSHELDIAVDVSGYTKGNRTALFARGLAPVQVNYLGYPGTMAAPFMDYIVVDGVLIAPEQRGHIAEQLMVMPGAYQPNDNAREISALPTARADFGLPEHAIVFCCFNQGFKITPREFDIWMRVLAAVPGSVLWLLIGNATARANLQAEAAARGIGPERLIFGEQKPHGEHLARLRHADLFLDTFAYNAHTTMSDALWAGLPAVTRIGRQFAARVGASLLSAVGLPELICHTDDDYEQLILALANDPKRLAALRRKLAAQLPTAALFDTAAYARSLESGLEAAVMRHRAGLPPCDLRIGPDGTVAANNRTAPALAANV